MGKLFTLIFAKHDAIDSNPIFNSKKSLDEYLHVHSLQLDSYNNYELYILAKNKGVKACQKWNKDIEEYWQQLT